MIDHIFYYVFNKCIIMPIPKKFRKNAKDYQKGSKKNGKYKEYKYMKQIKAEKEEKKKEIERKKTEKKKHNNENCYALHLIVFKLLSYEPDIFNFILGLLDNPIQKRYYAIECVKYLRETKLNQKDKLPFVNTVMDFNTHRLLLHSIPKYTHYVSYVIFNKRSYDEPVYFAEDGHMLEIYEYNDFDIENPEFGVLSPHKICKLYDNNIIIQIAHVMKYFKLHLNQLHLKLGERTLFREMYNQSTNLKYKPASYINNLFTTIYNHNPNLKILKAPNKYSDITEYSYYEILLYGKNIEEYKFNTIMKFSYGFNGHTGLNIHTTVEDFEFKFIDMKNVFECFRFD